jgi:hypothetical protein
VVTRIVFVFALLTACGDTPAASDGGAEAGPETGADASAVDAPADAIDSEVAPTCGYDAVVLGDAPAAYWSMSHVATEPDLAGNGHDGAYHGGAPPLVAMPDGCDQAADFDGATQYLEVPSSAAFSVPTTGDLTWEAWIRPDVLQFPNDTNGYVDWMGKCASYSPTCEWEARMYDTTNSQSRENRLSAYVFNPTAGLGSAADWQPASGLLHAGHWYHVVGEYTLHAQPNDCQNATTYPGAIDIWVDGVEWNHSFHGQTGCMSQYSVAPKANGSPLEIGTMARDSWFAGAIGKVALYDHLLTQSQITAHYEAMTGSAPTGSCADTCSF